MASAKTFGGARSWFTLLCVGLLASSAFAGIYTPRDYASGQSQCATQCSGVNRQIAYQTGQTYTYRVELSTRLPDSAPVQITTKAHISVHSPCELVLKLEGSQVQGVPHPAKLSAELEAQPIHFAYDDGQIVDVCGSEQEHQWAVEVKKAIISSLQMSSPDLTQTNTVIETDITGQCETIYQPVQSSYDGSVVLKTKSLDKCGKRHQINLGLFPRSYGLDQVIRSAMPLVNSTYECTQTIKDQVVVRSTCFDRQQMWPMSQSDVSSRIVTELLEQRDQIIVPAIRGSSFQKHQMTMGGEVEDRRYSVQEVETLLRQMCNKVIGSVELEVPQMFAELVAAKQSLSVSEEAQLWDLVQSGVFCPSTKLQDLYLDACAMAGSEGSVDVLIRAYQTQKIEQSRSSYLFSLLSFAKSPKIAAAERLVSFAQQNQQRSAILLGITGYIHNVQMRYGQTTQTTALVQQIQRILIENLESCDIESGSSQCITLVHGLKNVGLQQSDIAQRFVELLKRYKSSKNANEVRVAIVRTLVQVADDQIRRFLIDEIVTEPKESTELKIEAYRTVVMSGSTISQLEQIKRYTTEREETEPEFVNFVRSHQANLRKTADLHRVTILPLGAPEFQKPKSKIFGITRNYEFSYLNDPLNLGITAEADVVYEQDQSRSYRKPLVTLPESIAINITVPMMGKEFQAVELRVHQQGLDKILIRELRKMARSNVDAWTIVRELIDVISTGGEEMLAQNPDLRMLLEIAVDGKTLAILDQIDLVRASEQNQSIISEILETLHKRISYDHAFAFVPINFQTRMSTVNGLPIQLRVNSSVVFGLKTELNVDARDLSNAVVEFALWPSVAGQLDTSVEFFAQTHRKSIDYTGRFYSAPQVNLMFQVSEGRVVALKFNMPEPKYVLARIESQVRTETGDIIKRGDLGQDMHACTDFTRKPLGVALCYDLSYSREEDRSAHLVAELSLVKTDRALSSYELYAQLPVSVEELFAQRRYKRDEMIGAPIKFVFNTPGSEVNREIIFELELPQQQQQEISTEVQEARLRIQSPWKRVLALASVRNQDNQKVINLELSVDDERLVRMELALERLSRGDKIEYRPRMILAMAGSRFQPIHLTGVVSYQRGRKSVIHVNLEDVQQKRQYIKANLIKTGEMKKGDLKASTDINIDVLGLKSKVAGTFERSARVLKLDLATDYVSPTTGRQENAKVAFKLQNQSSGKMLKISNVGVVQMTQFPRYNAQYSHHLMVGSSEHFEHDLKLGWANDEEQIRAYQVVKVAGQRGKYDVEAQAIFVYRPKRINYEVKGTAALVGFGTNAQKRYNVVVDGQSRDGVQSPADFHGEFAYQHISKSPLKMKSRAAVKSATMDFVYSDEIQETKPNHFTGHLLMQLSPEEIYDTDYIYEISEDQYDHGVEFKMKNSKTGAIAHHQSYLRYIPSQLFHIQSKTQADQADYFNGELRLDAKGPSSFEFHHHPRAVHGLLRLSPYSNPIQGQLEFQHQGLKHESAVEYSPEQLLKISSKTKRDNENVLTLDTKLVPNQSSRLEISSKPFEGLVHYQYVGPEEREAQVQFNIPQSWSHQSKVAVKPSQDKISLKSQTRYHSSDVAELEAQYSPSEEHYFRLRTPLVHTDIQAKCDEQKRPIRDLKMRVESGRFQHENAFNMDDSVVQFSSKTVNKGRKLADLKYQWANQIHQLEFDSDDLVKGKAQCNLQKSDANLDLTLKHQGETFQHQTHLNGETGLIKLDSKTTRDAQNVAQINAQAGEQKYVANVRIGDHIDSKIELKPYEEGKIVVSCPHYQHETHMTMKPTAGQVLPDWSLKSLTVNPRTADRYEISSAHQAGQKAHFNVDLPQFDSQFSFDNSNRDQRQLEFGFNGKQLQSQLKHQTKIHYQKPILHLQSETTGQKGYNFLKLDGNYRHQDQAQPSTLEMKLGQGLTSRIEVNPFNSQAKYFQIEGDLQGQRGQTYRHQTRAQYEPDNCVLSVDSSTEKSGQKIAQLKSYLAADWDKESYIKFDGPEMTKAHIELHPRRRRAAMDIQYLPYAHQTEIYDSTEQDPINGAYQLKTHTTRAGQNVFRVDSHLRPNPSAQSHFEMEYGPRQYWTQAQLHPQTKTGRFVFQSPAYQHETEFGVDRAQDPKVYLKSKTLDQTQQILADIATLIRGSQGQNEIKCNLPGYFQFQSELNTPARQAKFDLQHSDRHYLGSLGANQMDDGRTYHVDFAWDVDRDPNSKFAVELTGRRAQSDQMIFIASFDYAANKLVFDIEGHTSEPIFHPIRVSLAYQPHYSRDSWQALYTHQMDSPNKFECKWEFLVQEETRYSAAITTQVGQGNYLVNAIAKSPEDQATLVCRFSPEQGIYEFNYALAQKGLQAGHLASLKIQKNQETGRIDGQMKLIHPLIDSQEASFYLDLQQRAFHLEASDSKSDAKLKIDANQSENGEMQAVAVARVPYLPEIDAEMRYIPVEELSAKIDIAQERKLDLLVKLVGSTEDQFKWIARVQTIMTPTLEWEASGAKNQLGQRTITFNGKYDTAQVVFAELKPVSESQGWIAQGWIKRVDGSAVAQLQKLQSIQSQDSHYYEVDIEARPLSQGKAFHLTGQVQQNSGNYIQSYRFQAFRDNQEVATGELEFKKQPYRMLIPERAEARIYFAPTQTRAKFVGSWLEQEDASNELSQEELTLFSLPQLAGQKVSEKSRNQAVLEWTDRQTQQLKKAGFVLVTKNYDQSSVAHKVQIYTPVSSEPTIEYNCAHHYATDLVYFKSEIKSARQIRNSIPGYQVGAWWIQTIQHQGRPASLSHFDLGKQQKNVYAVDVISYKSSSVRPIDALVEIRSGEQYAQNVLQIEAMVEQSGQSNQIYMPWSRQANNVTFHWALKTSDRKIDFGVDGHVSGSSLGLNWNNLDRHGHQLHGAYQLRFQGRERIEAEIQNPQSRYQIEGVYQAQAWNFQINGVKSGEQVQKRAVVKTEGQCIFAEVIDQSRQSQKHQITTCFDIDRSNLITVAVESINEQTGEQIPEVNFRLDTSEVTNSLKLNLQWNAPYLRKAIQTLYQQQHYESGFYHEIAHKIQILQQRLVPENLQTIVQELTSVIGEFGYTWDQVEEILDQILIEPAQAVLYQIKRLTSKAVVEPIKRLSRNVSWKLVQLCEGSSVCRRFAVQGDLAEAIVDRAVELLQHTHRIVVSSKTGKLINKWTPQITEAVHQLAHQANKWVQSQNPTIRQIVTNLETIAHELFQSQHLKAVNWTQVKQALEESVELACNPLRWATSSRVLVWDPKNGQLQIEVYGPAVQHPRYYQNQWQKYQQSYYNKYHNGGEDYYGSS